jgi:hypothetical protein
LGRVAGGAAGAGVEGVAAGRRGLLRTRTLDLALDLAPEAQRGGLLVAVGPAVVHARQRLGVERLERLGAVALPVRDHDLARVLRIAAVLEATGQARIHPIVAMDLERPDRRAAVARRLASTLSQAAGLDPAQRIEQLVEAAHGAHGLRRLRLRGRTRAGGASPGIATARE